MDKKIAGLLGAAAALTSMTTAAQAAPAQQTELAPATSYRDLLNPISNALPILRADDERLANQMNESTRLAQVSVQVGHHHHHHHHHHHGVRIRVGHHHHHHHVIGVRVGHHHHHHHSVRVRVHRDHD